MLLTDLLNQYINPYVLNPIGIWAAISLPIVLLIYLIRQKTRVFKLPSVVFLMQRARKKRKIWMRVPTGWMLLWHLLLVALLSAAIMSPFTLIPESQSKDYAVHIIDVSASMQAGDRFDQVKEIAKENLAATNTIIVTTPNPSVVLQSSPRLATLRVLSALRPIDSSTPLVSAISLAQSVGAQNAAIHIYSDFIDTTSQASRLTETISRLEKNGNIVVLHPVGRAMSNVGIVGAEMDEHNITLLVRNYNDHPVSTKLNEQSVELEAFDAKSYTFGTPKEKTSFVLTYQDSFDADNSFYFSPLPDIAFPLLYVANERNNYLTTALELFPFLSVTRYVPPGVSNSEDYTAFVFENVDMAKVLPGTVQKAFVNVEQGGVIIVKMRVGMEQLALHPAMPIKEVGQRKKSMIRMEDSKYTDGLTADSEEYVITAVPKEDTTILMSTQDGEPIVVIGNYGKGKVIYYGIDDMDTKSRFRLTYAYPILFQRILQTSLKYPTLEDLNRKTGQTILGNGIIQDPIGAKLPYPAVMRYNGFYESNTLTLASNLLNPLESDLSDMPLGIESLSALDIKNIEQKVPYNIYWIIILVVIAMLFIELIVLKWRREL